MKLQRLYSYVRNAIQDYNMIQDNDNIAIGISGGKDSLSLLYALSGLRNFYPHKFSITAITVNLGYSSPQIFAPIEDLCKKLCVEYTIVNTQINNMIQSDGCSLCARLRKGALNEKARELGCNKIAYAHNKDDVVETMLLSLIYEGRFSTFLPITYLEKTELSLIRPLIYVPSKEIVGFSNKYQLPIINNPCPFSHETERTYVRNLLHELNVHAPETTNRMMTAILSGNPDWAKN